MRESIPSVTKDGRNVLAVFPGVRSIHDALLDVAFAPIKDFSVVRGSFLDAGTSVEAGVVVSSARDVLDFALQSGKPHGARAVHSIVVQLLFKGQFLRLGIDSGVGSKFPVSVPTNTAIVAK